MRAHPAAPSEVLSRGITQILKCIERCRLSWHEAKPAGKGVAAAIAVAFRTSSSGDIALTRNACKALAILASYDSCVAELLASDAAALHAVLRAVHRHPQDREIAIAACEVVGEVLEEQWGLPLREISAALQVILVACCGDNGVEYELAEKAVDALNLVFDAQGHVDSRNEEAVVKAGAKRAKVGEAKAGAAVASGGGAAAMLGPELVAALAEVLVTIGRSAALPEVISESSCDAGVGAWKALGTLARSPAGSEAALAAEAVPALAEVLAPPAAADVFYDDTDKHNIPIYRMDIRRGAVWVLKELLIRGFAREEQERQAATAVVEAVGGAKAAEALRASLRAFAQQEPKEYLRGHLLQMGALLAAAISASANCPPPLASPNAKPTANAAAQKGRGGKAQQPQARRAGAAEQGRATNGQQRAGKGVGSPEDSENEARREGMEGAQAPSERAAKQRAVAPAGARKRSTAHHGARRVERRSAVAPRRPADSKGRPPLACPANADPTCKNCHHPARPDKCERCARKPRPFRSAPSGPPFVVLPLCASASAVVWGVPRALPDGMLVCTAPHPAETGSRASCTRISPARSAERARSAGCDPPLPPGRTRRPAAPRSGGTGGGQCRLSQRA